MRTPSPRRRIAVTGLPSRTAGLDLPVDRLGDPIHAADRLEHRRLLVEEFLEHERQAGGRPGHQVGQRERLGRAAGAVVAAGQLGIARLAGRRIVAAAR